MKAVLVKEMPENCLNCDGWRNAMGGYGCIYGHFVFDDLYIRQSECPFHPLPEDRYEEDFDWTDLTQKENAAMNHGWNKCLKAILKEVEV